MPLKISATRIARPSIRKRSWQPLRSTPLTAWNIGKLLNTWCNACIVRKCWSVFRKPPPASPGHPEVELPKNLKSRVLAAATRPGNADTETGRSTSRSLPPADARWSPRRLRRWLAPTSIAALSILLAGAIGMIVAQDRELDQLTAATQVVSETAAAAAPAGSQIADLRQTEDAGVTAGIASGADSLSGVQFEEPAARRESNDAANNTILDRLGLGDNC